MPISVTKQALVTGQLDEFLHNFFHSGEILPRFESEFMAVWQERRHEFVHNNIVAECPVGTVRYYLRCRGVVVRPTGTLRWPAKLKEPKRPCATTEGTGVTATTASMDQCLARVISKLRDLGGAAQMSKIGGLVWTKQDRTNFGRFTEFVALWPKVFDVQEGFLRLIEVQTSLALPYSPAQSRAASTTSAGSASWADIMDEEEGEGLAPVLPFLYQFKRMERKADDAASCTSDDASSTWSGDESS
mmetsp:Transcript_43208/g.106144  ORF Transcript_43208/g.106144 Transcript_43208/m.106144 type:complete len:245 (+) Transcript_43208:43-777(+)